MLNTIINAIQNRQVLMFTYSGLVRVVEPHAVGVSTTGKDVLRCFQTAGGHVVPGHEWDFCVLSKIYGLQITGQNFTGNRPGYKRNDRNMSFIYKQL